MFEQSATDKAMKYGAAAVIAIGTLWAIRYAARNDEKAEAQAMEAVVSAMDKSVKPLQRLQDAAIDGMAAHVERVQTQQAEARARAEEKREAGTPKAYRWKDATGQWHLSDSPPPGVQAEVIPIR